MDMDRMYSDRLFTYKSTITIYLNIYDLCAVLLTKIYFFLLLADSDGENIVNGEIYEEDDPGDAPSGEREPLVMEGDDDGDVASADEEHFDITLPATHSVSTLYPPTLCSTV